MEKIIQMNEAWQKSRKKPAAAIKLIKAERDGTDKHNNA